MSIFEMQKDLESVSEADLANETQSPSGRWPTYLVVTEVQRRVDMRRRYEAQASKAELSKPSVVEQRTAEMAGGGIPSVDPSAGQAAPPSRGGVPAAMSAKASQNFAEGGHVLPGRLPGSDPSDPDPLPAYIRMWLDALRLKLGGEMKGMKADDIPPEELFRLLEEAGPSAPSFAQPRSGSHMRDGNTAWRPNPMIGPNGQVTPGEMSRPYAPPFPNPTQWEPAAMNPSQPAGLDDFLQMLQGEGGPEAPGWAVPRGPDGEVARALSVMRPNKPPYPNPTPWDSRAIQAGEPSSYGPTLHDESGIGPRTYPAGPGYPLPDGLRPPNTEHPLFRRTSFENLLGRPSEESAWRTTIGNYPEQAAEAPYQFGQPYDDFNIDEDLLAFLSRGDATPEQAAEAEQAAPAEPSNPTQEFLRRMGMDGDVSIGRVNLVDGVRSDWDDVVRSAQERADKFGGRRESDDLALAAAERMSGTKAAQAERMAELYRSRVEEGPSEIERELASARQSPQARSREIKALALSGIGSLIAGRPGAIGEGMAPLTREVIGAKRSQQDRDLDLVREISQFEKAREDRNFEANAEAFRNDGLAEDAADSLAMFVADQAASLEQRVMDLSALVDAAKQSRASGVAGARVSEADINSRIANKEAEIRSEIERTAMQVVAAMQDGGRGMNPGTISSVLSTFQDRISEMKMTGGDSDAISLMERQYAELSEIFMGAARGVPQAGPGASAAAGSGQPGERLNARAHLVAGM